MKPLKKKEIIHNLRVDPRQRFYLRSHECAVIVEIILDQFKQALKEDRVIDLDSFARIFMADLGPRSLWNYNLRKVVNVDKCYMAKIKLKPRLRYEVKKALKEKGNA